MSTDSFRPDSAAVDSRPVVRVRDVVLRYGKTVETAEERQKLMFRVKAKIAPDLLQQHIRSVKTGLPGMAYVRLDEKAPWPDWLQIRLPAP